MPLHLNLYHEVASQKAASARDPLKIAMYILGAIVAVFALIYFWEYGKSSSLEHELSGRRAEFDKLDPHAREAEKREKDLKKTFETSDKLVAGIEGRFYWAPVLETVIKTVPREVQITKLSASVGGETVKRASLTFEGIAAGSDPRRVAEDLRQALAEEFGKKFKGVDASFRQLDDAAETVTVNGKKWPTAAFAIVLTLQTGDEASAAPAPERRRRREG